MQRAMSEVLPPISLFSQDPCYFSSLPFSSLADLSSNMKTYNDVVGDD